MRSPLVSPEQPWIPTRAEALRRLAAFIPRAGRTYAAQRNFDRGPGDRANVSTLSPYIRHRLLTEAEVLEAVLSRHSPSAAEKFIQEIFWRTYWKGWLESHPAAWSRYRSTLAARLSELDADEALAQAYTDAADGRTGIDAFDAWARELVDTNYLHNHARMWFASIWIFTLRLPWELGADLFMRHLLDGDPAANTLSWRWVAGLQTRGRTYTATRDNIRRYTGDRFVLAHPLVRSAPPLDDPPLPLVPLAELPAGATSDGQPALLVLHDDDLHGDLRDLPPDLRGVCAVRCVAGRSPRAVAAAVYAFTGAAAREAVSRIAAVTGAVDLGLIEPAARASSLPVAASSNRAATAAAAGPLTGSTRLGEDAMATDPRDVAAASVAIDPHDVAAGVVSAADVAADVVSAAARCGAARIVAPFAPVGPVRDVLAIVAATAIASGLTYEEIGRRYDAVSWPAATRGFFNLRVSIPGILRELGIGPG